MKKVLFFALAMILLLSFAACNGGNTANGTSSNTLIGTWVNENGDVCFVFYEDGSCLVTDSQRIIPTVSVNYKAAQNQTITFADVYNYPYAPVNYLIEDDILYIEPTSGEFIFTRAASNPTDSVHTQTNDTDAAIPKELRLPVSLQETTCVPWNRDLQTTLYIEDDDTLNYGDETVDTNVRSIVSCEARYNKLPNLIYLKNDGSVWGLGDGAKGRLGDDTGLDREAPIKIMDNVKWVFTSSMYTEEYCALKNDNTVWTWGSGKYAPVLVTEDVELPGFYGQTCTLTPSGNIYTVVDDMPSFFSGIDFPPLRDFTYRYPQAFFIDNNKKLWMIKNVQQSSAPVEIADNVEKIYTKSSTGYAFDIGIGPDFCLFTKSDGSLWGVGDNTRGQLGDGTLAPRDTAVKIADDVVSVFNRGYLFLKSNGELWTWDSSDPIPRKTYDDVAILYDNGDTHDTDGLYYRNSENYLYAKLPKTITFDME